MLASASSLAAALALALVALAGVTAGGAARLLVGTLAWRAVLAALACLAALAVGAVVVNWFV